MIKVEPEYKITFEDENGGSTTVHLTEDEARDLGIGLRKVLPEVLPDPFPEVPWNPAPSPGIYPWSPVTSDGTEPGGVTTTTTGSKPCGDKCRCD